MKNTRTSSFEEKEGAEEKKEESDLQEKDSADVRIREAETAASWNAQVSKLTAKCAAVSNTYEEIAVMKQATAKEELQVDQQIPLCTSMTLQNCTSLALSVTGQAPIARVGGRYVNVTGQAPIARVGGRHVLMTTTMLMQRCL